VSFNLQFNWLRLETRQQLRRWRQWPRVPPRRSATASSSSLSSSSLLSEVEGREGGRCGGGEWE
jgi:hypothetical protein